jgi:LacI family transcriptional regulator
VLVNRSEERDRAPSVVSDDRLGMKLAVNHLVGLGHRNIGQIAGPFSTSTGERRRIGFLNAMAEHGLAGHVIEAVGYTREAGASAGREILQIPRLSAIVAANDLLALGPTMRSVGGCGQAESLGFRGVGSCIAACSHRRLGQ